MTSYASLLAARPSGDIAWSIIDQHNTGYGEGYICNCCGTAKNTFKRLDRLGENWMLAWCVSCYDFKMRPAFIKNILQTDGPAAAAAWVQKADREAAAVRATKEHWEADFVRRYAEMQMIVALPPPKPIPWYRREHYDLCSLCAAEPWDCHCQEDWECDEEENCGCGACEEHDPSHPANCGGT